MGLRYIFALLISVVVAICCCLMEWADGMIKGGAPMKIPRGFTKKQWVAILEEMDDVPPAPPAPVVEPVAPRRMTIEDPEDMMIGDLFDLTDDEIVRMAAAERLPEDSDDEDEIAPVRPDDGFEEDMLDLSDDEDDEIVRMAPAEPLPEDLDEDYDLGSIFGEDEDPFVIGDDDAVVAAFDAPGKNRGKNRRKRAAKAEARARALAALRD